MLALNQNQNQQRAIRQTGAVVRTDVLYLKIICHQSANGLTAEYDYTQSGYVSGVTDITNFCANVIDMGTNYQAPHLLSDYPPLITTACYVVMAIDMFGTGKFRKTKDAATTDDATLGEYFNLMHYQDDYQSFKGNDLLPIGYAPTTADCHMVYFNAIYGSTQGGMGYADHFNLYLNIGILDPDIRNPGH
jgi:hypothetical protein